MAKRRIDTVGNGNVRVNVYWNSELQEYTCVLLVDGRKVPATTYYTADKQDAISTALDMMETEYKHQKSMGFC